MPSRNAADGLSRDTATTSNSIHAAVRERGCPDRIPLARYPYLASRRRQANRPDRLAQRDPRDPLDVQISVGAAGGLVVIGCIAFGIGVCAVAAYAAFMDLTTPSVAATQFRAFMGASFRRYFRPRVAPDWFYR